MLWTTQNLVGGPFFDNFACLHHGDAVTNCADHIQIMADERTSAHAHRIGPEQAQSFAWMRKSSAATLSSSTRNSGDNAKARASTIRCRWPPLKLPGRRIASSADSPTSSSNSCTVGPLSVGADSRPLATPPRWTSADSGPRMDLEIRAAPTVETRDLPPDRLSISPRPHLPGPAPASRARGWICPTRFRPQAPRVLLLRWTLTPFERLKMRKGFPRRFFFVTYRFTTSWDSISGVPVASCAPAAFVAGDGIDASISWV